MSSSEWKNCTLGELVTFQRGHDLTTNNVIEGQYPVVGSSGIIAYHNKYTTQAPCITIGRSGNSVGKRYYCNYNCWAHNTTLYIKEYINTDPQFIYYYLETLNLQHYAGGSAVPTLNRNHIHPISVYVPSKIEEQKQIAYIFSTIDEKIETNNVINKNLEEMAQAIFKQWFVDFEFPNEDGEPYKSSGGEMIESEMGLIPKGWSVKALDEIAEYLNGLAMQKYRPNETELGLPVLKIKELRQGRTDESSDLCSNEIAEQYIINDGDIIFSWSGSLLVDIWCGGKCGLNQHLFKVTSSEYEKWVYNYWTKYHLDKFIRIAEGKATTMGHIKRGDLTNSLTVIPDKKVYDKANGIFKPLLDRMIKARVESRKLEVIRDKLLPKLMSGEIRVPINN